MNEATLEARIDRILATVFPTFKEVRVKHQMSFSVRIGHHTVSVDLKEPSSYPIRAICDILLTIDDKPIILLELKNENLALTQSDIDQGISYAKLIDPMPPLTLVSNGSDNWFFKTYTKEKLSEQTVDFALIQQITDSSFKLAQSDFKNAISTLLSNDTSLFAKIINQISAEKFLRMTGGLADFSKPIAYDFHIDRDLIPEIELEFSAGVPLVGVIGPAFSGKTNVLHSFFLSMRSNNCYLLYLDCADHNYSILQQLANHFTKQTKVHVTKDKIREWMINSLEGTTNAHFYLLLDNFNDEIPEEIKSEVIELIDIFRGTNLHTLYTTDELNYQRIAFVENRQYQTIIGQQSKILKLEQLNDQEYNRFNHFLLDNYGIVIEHGGHYSPEYREARILRHLTSLYKHERQENQYKRIPAVPDLEHLNLLVANKTYSHSVHVLYKAMATCFLAEHHLRKRNPYLEVAASGSGAITLATFEKLFPSRVNALLRSSLVVLRTLQNQLTVIFPRIPELLAKYSIESLTLEVLKDAQHKPIQEICSAFVERVIPMPYNDVVATGVLMALAEKREVDLFSGLVQELMDIPPKDEPIKDGTKTLSYIEGAGHIEMNFEGDSRDGGFVGDFLPYAILSQLARYPLKLIDTSMYNEYAFHLTLLHTVGSIPSFIRREDARSISNMAHYQFYDWPGVGRFVSGGEGIIEPIVQSMLQCYMEIPDAMEMLCERAFQENNFILLWRLQLAIRTLTTSVDAGNSQRANKFMEKFLVYFDKFMSDLLSRNIEDPVEKAQVKEMLLAMDFKSMHSGRNSPVDPNA